jgi:hypothetical protein
VIFVWDQTEGSLDAHYDNHVTAMKRIRDKVTALKYFGVIDASMFRGGRDLISALHSGGARLQRMVFGALAAP